jgi:gp16 family phage-associated protein
MKTAADVREDFRRRGITVAGWARKHGFTVQSVRRVIRGDARCWYGNGHKIAVLLGMKDGEISG